MNKTIQVDHVAGAIGNLAIPVDPEGALRAEIYDPDSAPADTAA